MKKNKIFELKIEDEDEISGIDSISLVDEPAIEINWVAFHKHNHSIEDEDLCRLNLILDKSEDEELMFSDGWEVKTITLVDNKESFVSTSPNDSSWEDTKTKRIRYKYILNPRIGGQPAVIPTTRRFCRELIAQNRVFRVEDIENARNDFGESPLLYRGSWNCRHIWARIEYVKTGSIINKASVNTNKVIENGFPTDLVPDLRVIGYTQPSTVTDRTAGNPSPSTIKNLGLSKFKIDTEKRIVCGPAMVPNYEILRRDKNGEPYYVFFSEETIKMIAEKYMRNKFIDNNDTDHSGKAEEDVYVYESWIKEDKEDKANKYGFGDLPIGTWFVSMKIKNDEVWQRIKNKELNGFSVSGFFEEIEQFVMEKKFLLEVEKIIKNM